MERLVWINRALIVIVLLLAGYWVWSFQVSSRYQALCGASFWQMNAAQRDACDDVKTELDQKQ